MLKRWCYIRGLYWFKRDLRSYDNRGLVQAYVENDELVAVYVLDDMLLHENGLISNVRYLNFLVNALEELSRDVKLGIFVGNIEDVFDYLLSRFRCDAVYTSKSFSWSEQCLSDKVRELCRRYGVRYVEILDNLLSDPSLPHAMQNFASFYKSWLRSINSSTVDRVPLKKFRDVENLSLEELVRKLGLLGRQKTEFMDVVWGRRRLYSFKFEDYDRLRDYPYKDGVSRLSHFINLGVLSIREIYNVAKERSQEFIRQLAWREYFYKLWTKYPWMNELELRPYMRGLEWENDKYLLECFIEGKTGYPIVDAGIRQLKEEGWIHNRVRLIVANFLVKDLHIDWRIGVEFFKTSLLDYDEVLNTGNWQWAASVGVDTLPIRIFNPIKQAEKYDPLCLYIKRYVPELEDQDCRSLHNPLMHRIKGYYEPIVDHYEAIKKYIDCVRRHKAGQKAR